METAAKDDDWNVSVENGICAVLHAISLMLCLLVTPAKSEASIPTLCTSGGSREFCLYTSMAP